MTAVAVREPVLSGTRAPRVVDVLLGAGLAVFAQADLRYNLDNSTHYGPDLVTAIAVAVATLALIWWRRQPLVTLAVVVAATAGPEIVMRQTITLWGHFVPLLLACYAVARWGSRRVALIGAAITLAACVLIMIRVPEVGTAGNIPFTFVPLTAVFVMGRVLRRRAERHHDLAARAEHLEQLESERRTALAAAIEEERNRIARELHDIVSHCVSVMVVQAGASEELMTRAPDRARESMRAVQETGQQAVAELGRMLGLLRGDPEIGRGLVPAPQPGTAQLPELADRMSGLGLPVQLTFCGARRALPPGVDLTAYRIVQEALTNTLKHADHPQKSVVELRYLPRALEIDVVDDGAPLAVTTSRGHGLVGMSERVAVYGGEIETGAGPEGGFRVHVVLPLEPT
jgi:signal transduction histidine kinase